MTSAGPHLGMSIGDMSLATANLIHGYALPVLIVGAVLTLAGAVGVLVSDGVRGRYAAQAFTLARSQAVESAPTKPPPRAAAPPPAVAVPLAVPPGGAVAQNQLMAATGIVAPQIAPSPAASTPVPSAPPASTVPKGEATASTPAPPKAAPRSLSGEQRASMLAALHGQAEDVWFVTGQDPEAQHFADQLGAVFREAGWTDHHALVLHPGQPFQGVSAALKTTSADRSVSRAFLAAGVPLSFREKGADEPAPTVYVGSPSATP